MDSGDLNELLVSLCQLPQETEWVEFKLNWTEHDEIGEYVSAIANSACLHDQAAGFIVWGRADSSHEIEGTSFHPKKRRVGNEELENWLLHLLEPSPHLRIHEFEYDGRHVVIFEVPPARHMPVRFKGTEYIRVGTYKKKLKDFPEKERELWNIFSKAPFEQGIAIRAVRGDEVLNHLIDYPSYFDLVARNLPANRSQVLANLVDEKILAKAGSDRYHVTNLGAVLFARDLNKFEGLGRKGIRVVFYEGTNRIRTLKEQLGVRGYASGFEGLISFINDRLPHNELIGQAIRKEVPMYPEAAIRELVANMLIHQDFSMSGTGPIIEIFEDRVEITNPGTPLIDVNRFLDLPPRSRNEALAALMRRIGICEERGSGIDKVIDSVEVFQLPPPDFAVLGDHHTKAVLFGHKKLSTMNKIDRIRACYQHAGLKYVSNTQMTNASFRKRLLISDENYAIASRIISETLQAGLIKPTDPQNRSRKHASYVPFWA